MCGIAAWITKNKFSEKKFDTMLDSLAHRGPDNRGVFHNKSKNYNIALGNRRLSILDLSSKGHQPYAYNNLIIVYNGEIYNYLEIRKELQQLGYKFNSGSDTEVLIKAYYQWKNKCLDKLNGMFAFIIYDKNNHKLFIARDRFGIKPLYYQITKSDIKIASEIKAFTIFNDFKPIGNLKIIGDFLVNRYLDHTEDTFFTNIKQLTPGSFMGISLNNFKTKKKRWYILRNNLTIPLQNELTERFKELFVDSVRLRLRSDVEVGSCLSGGLDSSSVVCIADYLLKQHDKRFNIQTFTSSFKNKSFDERQYVKKIKKQKSIRDNYIFPKPEDFFKEIDRLTYFQDEPPWSTSIYAQYKVFSLANNKNVKVTLDGQGGDEDLGGYHNLFLKYQISNAISSYNLVELISLFLQHRNLVIAHIQSLKNQKKMQPFKSVIIQNIDVPTTSIQDFSLYLFKHHLPALLHYGDRNSMANSIEARLPFLDHRLVEFSLSLPNIEKFHNGLEKFILRKAMEDYVPDKILKRRDKMGFVTPQNIWMKKYNNIIQTSVKNLWEYGIFDEEYLTNIIQSKKSQNELMRLYMLTQWIKTFNIDKFA